MRSLLLVSLVLLGASVAQAGPASPEAWSPFQTFLGSWSGKRVTPEGDPKVAREYEPAANNQQIQITEKNGRQPSDWGTILYDSEREAFVLKQTAPDGKVHILTHDPSASSQTRIVFMSVESNPGQTRVTYEKSSRDEFVERVEHAATGQEFGLVSETHFKRKGY